MSNRIYLDYNATTPMSPEVLDFYKDQLSLYANASSLHEDGRRAKKEIEIARKNEKKSRQRHNLFSYRIFWYASR